VAAIRLKYVKTEYHGGKPYRYFRRRGFSTKALPGIPGSAEFMAAYQAALAGGSTEVGASRTKPGTNNALVASYYNNRGRADRNRLQSSRSAASEWRQVPTSGRSPGQ
jgi:hypothetical protein